jgi:hypothetical protein
MKNLTRMVAVGLLVAVAFAVLPSQADAILSADIRGGVYTDPEDFFLGGGLRIGVAGFEVIPNFEYVFVSNATRYTLNVDGQWNLLPFGLGSAWVGGGLGLMGVGIEGFDTNTDGLINLFAGVGLNVILKPYAQAKYIISDSNQGVLSLGVRF